MRSFGSILSGNKSGGRKGPPRGISHKSTDPWDLGRRVTNLSPDDEFTLQNAVEGIAIFGELGGAKSTGSLPHFVLPYMAMGMGGLFNCVKPGDRELIEEYALMTGRSNSLIIVSPENSWRCNLMRYALKRPGAVGSRVEQLVSLLMTIVDASERSDRGAGRGDKFWLQSLRQLLRNAMEVNIAARGDVSMSQLHEVITSAPRTSAELHNPDWQKRSACYQRVEEAEKLDRPAGRQRDYELSARYLFAEYPEMPPETRGSVFATYSALADVLLRGQMAELFDTETNFIPDLSFEGAIIVLDIPVKVYGPEAILAQVAFTYLWQLAAEQRNVKANPRPVMWIVDEAQEFVCDYTPRFLATSRSQLVAPILITQNISNYFAAFGGENGRHHVEAILGNTATKIFHANGHIQTNKWASDMISEELQTRVTWHRTGEGPGQAGGSENVGRKVLPSEFTQYKKGGAQNGFKTQALIYRTGASFAANDGQPFLRAELPQIIPGVTVPGSGK